MTRPSIASLSTVLSVSFSLLLLVVMMTPYSSAFVIRPSPLSASALLPPSPFSSSSSKLSATAAESEAEALLRRARELKAAAAEAEKQVHNTLLDKKAQRDAETDKVIDNFFPHGGTDSSDMDLDALVHRIKTKRPSSDLLLRVVDRLHEREVAAQGLAHVEPSVHHDHTEFQVVKSEVDEKELNRVSGLIDRLIDAANVLDEEWYKEKAAKGEKYKTHNELVHWSAGDVAKTLQEKAKDLRREHDETFKKRQEEYYAAARKKDKQEYYEQEF
mmetsp:Transcript_22747/g.47244  ORF Transcript_22747/g.47244 Transcript_22747/m.47244 type:complete len:273 (+) Transcript_22747:391-1209(+)|eukprot:CAMPEP_0178502564 /NCGR_PEP_ID=MMETSP0696-20121128/17572_1 /TAXON_ID=265572 /ORGANISM="Extubocellulus spinifer, Strain CCMP396" /LENGTH=272 /DNA_ID=CAMNT_0020131631 /DNA_START=113 /DNA_END=931 /DNA_ORIENTATION=+